MNEWTCFCGHVSTEERCESCGRMAPDVTPDRALEILEADPVWDRL